MWRWLINLSFPLIAILAGLQMFILKDRVIKKEEELKQIHRQILSDNREIHMLEAEWAVENDPNRLREFVRTQTKLSPIRSNQFVTVEDLPLKMAPKPAQKPDLKAEDTEEQSQ